MKKLIVSLSLVVVAAEIGWTEPAVEKPYDFRARLADVHRPNRRDWKLAPAADEFAFADGQTIALPVGAPDLVRTAAEDFRDYLLTSMGVNVSVRTAAAEPAAVRVTLDGTLKPRAYAIAVTSGRGVDIRAYDAKAAAQAFYRLEDRMNLRMAPFLKTGDELRRPRFSPRMTHSGWGCDQFPDAHLAQMAHYGLDAILIFVKDVDVTKGVSRIDIADTIRRAKAKGLDTYLYSYVVAFHHPDEPGAAQAFADSYGRIAAAYPEAKGIIFVGESCQFPSKDERALPYCYWEREKIAAHRKRGDNRPTAGWFPCRDYPQWLNAVKGAIRAKAPEMEIVFWSYNWGYHPEDLRLQLIDALPRDITLQATFEMFEKVTKRNGLKSGVADYSLVYEGPGRYFSSEAKRAKELGFPMYAMSNTGGHTWDFGTIPFDPFPYQWKKRFDAVVKAHDDWNLAGLMENHHYGWWPSFVSELSKEAYTEGGMSFDAQLAAIAARDYGAENVQAALAVWKDWSARIVDMHATDENQYGPFRYGPAYPFNAMESDLKPDDLPIPPMYLTLNYRSRASNDANLLLQLELLKPMAASFLAGGAKFRAMAAAQTDAGRREAAFRMGLLGEYMGRCCLTACNVKSATMAERAKDRAKVEAIAREEYENARAALKLVEADSRLGWEPTMLYRGGPEAIRWKLRYLEEHYSVAEKKAEQAQAGVPSNITLNANHDVEVVDFGPWGEGGYAEFEVADFAAGADGRSPVLRISYACHPDGLGEKGDFWKETAATYLGKDIQLPIFPANVNRYELYTVDRRGHFRAPLLQGLVRYARLKLDTPGGSVTVKNFRLANDKVHSAGERAGSFSCSDERLNAVWESSVRTCELCSIPSYVATNVTPSVTTLPYLADGAKRDRLVWSGDLWWAERNVFFGFKPEAPYMKGSIEMLAANQTPEGYVQASPWPEQPKPKAGEWGPFQSDEFAAWFVPVLADYVLYTGDFDTARRQLPVVRRLLGYLKAHCRADGIFEQRLETSKHASSLAFGSNSTHHRAFMNVLLWKTYVDAAQLAEWTGDADAAKAWRKDAAVLADAIRAVFWDAEQGWFRDAIENPTAFGWHASALAMAAGFVTKAEAEALHDQFDRTGHGKFQALGARGLFEQGYPAQALRLVAEHGWYDVHKEREWKGLRLTSECMGLVHRNWGDEAHPDTALAGVLSNYVLGAEPLEPGWKKFRVRPRPACGIRWAKGTVPTPAGEIEISWKLVDRRPQITVKAPPGLTYQP